VINFLKKIAPFFILILILVGIEFYSNSILSSKNISCDLFYNKADESEFWCLKDNYAYTQIDPLLGWSIDYSKIDKADFIQKNNSTYISSLNINCNDTLIIYISGGSTSDLTYDKNNWPKSLLNTLERNNICSEIYIAAVAGYSSGQELLKSIRDINKIKPDIHISYSGVNEMENPNYVSWYETHLIESIFSKATILPSTITLLKSKIDSHPKITIKNIEHYNAVDFWQQNMKNMNGLAIANNYFFIGVLQPVFKFEEHLINTENKNLAHFANDYIQFYPEARNISSHANYIFDLSRTFDDYQNNVFKDDCHLSDEKYQDIIGNKIYNIIDSLYFVKNKKI